jgi:tetratricopeptide (TPR) repeat protein
LILAHLLDDLGSVALRRGRLNDAIANYNEAADAAASLGAAEVEIGARMNVGLAHAALLQHGEALRLLRALVQRIQTVDYPSMRRFAGVHYAEALMETGDFAAARTELQRTETSEPADALADVRLDAATVRLALGDTDAARAAVQAIRDRLDDRSPPDRRLLAAALLLRAQNAAGNSAVAHDRSNWNVPGADVSTRAQAQLALAQWHASVGDTSSAAGAFRDALGLVRQAGIPAETRNVAVVCATFQIAQNDLEGARETASLVAPYAADDFAINLLLARVAIVSHDAGHAHGFYDAAHRLAGDRWTATLAAEQAAAEAPRTVAHSLPP